MVEFNYYELLKQMKNVYGVRKKLIECASAFGISAAAREYSTTRKTVRKRLRRYNQYGLKGLEDESRKPKHSHFKMKKEEEEEIIRIRKKHPYMGAERINMNLI